MQLSVNDDVHSFFVRVSEAMSHPRFIDAHTGQLPPAFAKVARRALDELQRSLLEQSGSIKLHAAESLLALGLGKGVLACFDDELRRHGTTPVHRICIWRVLARAEPTEANRSRYVEKIRDAFLDPDSPDPACAVESLSKLRYRIDAAHRPRFEQAMERLPSIAVPHARWLLAVSGDGRDLEKLAKLLDSLEPLVRGIAAYALRHLYEGLPSAVVERIAAAAAAEPASEGRKYLVSAAYVTAPDASHAAPFKASLFDYLRKGDNDEKYEAASALAIRGDSLDLGMLVELCSTADAADVRVAAATAVLQILRRAARPLPAASPHMLHDPERTQWADPGRTSRREA